MPTNGSTENKCPGSGSIVENVRKSIVGNPSKGATTPREDA